MFWPTPNTVNVCLHVQKLILRDCVFVLLLLGAKEGHEPSGVEASPFSCQSGVLARFLSVSGHVALCQLVHLEGGVLGEIKRRQEVLETEREKERQAKKTKKKDTAADATKVMCYCPLLEVRTKRKMFLSQIRGSQTWG